MSQNKSVMDRLLNNNKKQKNKIEITEAEHIINDESHVLITTHRVENVRYKIYTLVLLLVGIFGVINYVIPSYEKYQDTKEGLKTIETQTSIFDARERKHNQDKLFILKIEEQEDKIINYLNDDKGFDDLDSDIQEQINVIRNYLQITPISSSKMRVDEKIILANINEYLLRSEERRKNGEINKIEIGNSEEFDLEGISQLPIMINVTFDDKNGLLSFIKNIEKKVLPDSHFRVLYKINEISYDIVNYREEQEVDIALTAYFIE